MKNYPEASAVKYKIPTSPPAHPGLFSYSFHSCLLFLIPFNDIIYLPLWLA